MKTIYGATFSVYLNSSMCDPTEIRSEIQRQLPESFHGDDFMVLCEGKNILSFGPLCDPNPLQKGVGPYFNSLACIYVLNHHPPQPEPS